MTYLIVDDEPADLELLRVALGTVVEDREIVAHGSAEAALGWLEAREHDNSLHTTLLITDLKMPRCDGAELVHEVRSRWPPGPVSIVLSTSQRPSDATRAYLAGAHAYHSKPMGFHDTVELCRRIDDYWNATVGPEPTNKPQLGQMP